MSYAHTVTGLGIVDLQIENHWVPLGCDYDSALADREGNIRRNLQVPLRETRNQQWGVYCVNDDGDDEVYIFMYLYIYYSQDRGLEPFRYKCYLHELFGEGETI